MPRGLRTRLAYFIAPWLRSRPVSYNFSWTSENPSTTNVAATSGLHNVMTTTGAWNNSTGKYNWYGSE